MYSNTKKILLLLAITLGFGANHEGVAIKIKAVGFVDFVSPYSGSEIFVPVGVDKPEDAIALVSQRRSNAEKFVQQYPDIDDDLKRELKLNKVYDWIFSALYPPQKSTTEETNLDSQPQPLMINGVDLIFNAGIGHRLAQPRVEPTNSEEQE